MTMTTFAITDEADIAVEPPDEDELVDDDMADDEDEITEIPVHGVLAPEGVPTGDGRQFGDQALTTRNLPLPIAYQLLSGEGHDGAATVGRIDEVFREGNEMRFRGAIVLTKEHSAAVIEGIIDGTVRGVSVDVDDVEVDMSVSDDAEAMNSVVFSHARIAGVTIVPIPAFQEAYIALGHEFAEDGDMTPEQALAACGCEGGPEDDDENPDVEMGYDAYRDVSTEERKRRAKDGTAMPDGSYPIGNCDDLRNAIQAIGRAKNPDATKAHIRKRKSALGCEDVELPDTWAMEDQIAYTTTATTYSSTPTAFGNATWTSTNTAPILMFAPGTHDGPGWITHPIPTARIRRYWTHGRGAAKIRWGAPGDFNRCRRQLAKYVRRPDWLAGLCANMHKEALGYWPSTHRRLVRGHSLVASGEPAPIFNLVASANYVFDASLFAKPQMETPRVGVVVEDDRTYGYIAQWGVCHIGLAGVCTEAPPSQTDYWYYATGILDTTEGPIHVGQITMDTGHAPMRANAKVAAAHYDNTGAAVADVVVGEDEFGIWFSGALRSTVTDEQRHALRAAGRVSGDWREIGGALELVAALAVNVPGFPIPHVTAGVYNGKQMSLVAAGIPAEDDRIEAVVASAPTPLDAMQIAGIARAAVAEYRHQEKRAEQAKPIRATLRQKKIEALRTKVKE